MYLRVSGNDQQKTDSGRFGYHSIHTFYLNNSSGFRSWRLSEGWRPMKTWRIRISQISEFWIRLRKTWGKIFGVDNIALSGSIFFWSIAMPPINGMDWMNLGFGPIEDCGRDLNHKTQISFTVNRFCGFLWFSNNMK